MHDRQLPRCPWTSTPRRQPPIHHSCLRIRIQYLIWKLRCEWRIQREADPSQRHTTSEIRNRWLSTINSRLRLDCLLADRRRYGYKTLRSSLVQRTWQGTLHDEPSLPDDWHKITGVLVGMGVPRPPGRNRRPPASGPLLSPTHLVASTRV